MEKDAHREWEIAFAVKHAEMFMPVTEVIRKIGISEQVFYQW